MGRTSPLIPSRSSFTAGVYAVVAEELAEDAAEKIAVFVPRPDRA